MCKYFAPYCYSLLDRLFIGPRVKGRLEVFLDHVKMALDVVDCDSISFIYCSIHHQLLSNVNSFGNKGI